MQQVMLELDAQADAALAPHDGPAAAAAAALPAQERCAFEIGWEHARHGLVPALSLLQSAPALAQGWHAARALFGARAAASSPALRQWLALRLHAWQIGAELDAKRLTPRTLARLQGTHCPITRLPLGGSGATAAQPMRLCEQHPFDAGNLVFASRAAAQARQGLDAVQAIERAERLARLGENSDAGLDAAAWARLACLLSLVVELPHALALRVPLRVLPPAQLRLANPVQGLQAALTLALYGSGWSRRAAALAERLPRTGLRQDFNCFVGALAPRLMSVDLDGRRQATDALSLAWAQADVWADARVQRRWALFAIQLDADACRGLLAQLEHGLAAFSARRGPRPGCAPR